MLAIQKPSSGTIQRARDQKFTGMYPQGRPVLSGEFLYYLNFITFVALSNKQGLLNYESKNISELPKKSKI